MTKKDQKLLEKRRLAKNVPEKEYLTQMRDSGNALEIEDLRTCFFTDAGVVQASNGVSFDVPMGKTVAVVGESGCGKSAMGLSVMQLLQRPQGQVVGGQIRLNLGDKAYDIAKTPEIVMEKLRGKAVSMIFQEPMTALNPVMTIGKQLQEVLALHEKKRATKRHAIKLLEKVGIANSKGVYEMYPHNLSGGMRQRVMIAMALSCNPRLIIADEPTTALDVTIQAQILELLKSLKEKTGSAVLLITHDLGVVAEMADFVVVMYAGRVVEKGTVEEIFYQPAHPYTVGLMKSKPVVGRRVESLYTIAGQVPNPINMPDYCYFRDRCDTKTEDCDGQYPAQIQLSDTHIVSCYRAFPREDTDGKHSGS